MSGGGDVVHMRLLLQLLIGRELNACGGLEFAFCYV